MEKWYQLGGNSSMFWDPLQPTTDQQKLLIGEAKKLKRTERVTAWVRKGGLIELSEREAQEIMDKNEELKKNLKVASKVDKKMEAVAKKEEEVKAILREAELKLKAAEEIQAENAQLKVDKQQLMNRVAELEAAAAQGKK
jgi:hypothetical protein